MSAAGANPPDAVWVFDVDGTLIGSIRSDQLRPGAEELIATLRQSGTALVAWSAGGADYAERMLGRFGLEQHFCAFYDKADRGGDGRYLIEHLRPDHRPGTLVDDYPGDVPEHARVIAVRQFLGGNPADRGLQEAIAIAAAQLQAACAGRWGG